MKKELRIKLDEARKTNIYIKNAKEIKRICDRDGCDIGVGYAKWEHEAGINWTKEQAYERNEMIKEFQFLCNKLTLNAICEEI